MKRARDDVTVMEEGDDLDLHEEEGGGGGEGYGGQLEACDVLLSLACGTLHEEEAPVPRRQRRRRRGAAFECRTCGRRFASFQALGGHRTSHLRAGKTPPSKSKAVVHACGVCGLAFSMGQALGGHMRRHRATTTDAGGADPDLEQIMVQQSCRPLQLLDLFL